MELSQCTEPIGEVLYLVKALHKIKDVTQCQYSQYLPTVSPFTKEYGPPSHRGTDRVRLAVFQVDPIGPCLALSGR